MTKLKMKRIRKLSREILGLLGITFLIALFLLQFLGMAAAAIAEQYLFMNDIVLTETQYVQLYDWLFNLSLVASVAFFVILFLFLLGERLSYIREVIAGIEALRNGMDDYTVPLEGNNELTELAEAVNFLSLTQREIKKQERALSDEKDQFVRSMSHDIRTPLTSILAYSELLIDAENIDPEIQTRYLKLIRHKASQIKELTDVLLDGTKRNLEHFDDCHLLMVQLMTEFEASLEDDFQIESNLDCPSFSGMFDIQELRRIFDNLISNVQKYADPANPVTLSVSLVNHQLLIRQENAVRKLDEPAEGYQIGLRSIQRIAQNYAGRTDIKKDDKSFSITILLSEI